MTEDAVTAARSFIAGVAEQHGDAARAQLTGLLNRLIEIAAVDAALDAVPPVHASTAAAHRAALAAARAATVDQLVAVLHGWASTGRPVLSAPLSPPAAVVAPASPEPADVHAWQAGGVEPRAATPASPPAPPPESRETEEAIDLSRLRELQAYFAGALPAPESPAPEAAIDTRAALGRLRSIVEGLSLPPAGAQLDPSTWQVDVARLDGATYGIDYAWGDLPAEYQRLLVAFCAAYARHLQDDHSTETAGDSFLLSRIFHRLTAFSAEHRPGMVNGLARHQRPETTWLEDARSTLTHLRSLAGLPGLDGATTAARPVREPAKENQSRDLEIDTFLRDEGFADSRARARARALLEEHRLTNPGKQRMAPDKAARARALFREAQVRVCNDPVCAEIRAANPLATGPAIRVAATACDICAGSNNRRAVLALSRRMTAAGESRLLIVGGSDDSRSEMQRLFDGTGIELRLIDGTLGSRSLKEAKQDMNWAQVLVIWGSTELDHKVSNLYKSPPGGVRTVRLNRRGIEAMCHAALDTYTER